MENGEDGDEIEFENIAHNGRGSLIEVERVEWVGRTDHTP